MADFPSLENDVFLKAAFSEPVPYTPVWMMRQAGRYLPEYRATRASKAFFDVVRNPKLAAEITLQPIERFPLDAAIIFSDILVVPQAMGMHVEMVTGKGPVFPTPLESATDLKQLCHPHIYDDLGYVLDALTETRHRLAGRVPLIGFCGAPWTLMAYMIEGSGSKTFAKARSWFYKEPQAATDLLDRITTCLEDYLIAQVQAGAQALQVFDSWAGLMTPDIYEEVVMPYMRRLVKRVKAACPSVPLIGFAKGAPFALSGLADAGFDVLGLDWTMDPREVRRLVNAKVALQGNLDPCALYGSPAAIREAVANMLDRFGPIGHIANLGHGMHPDHDPDHAGVFIDAVHDQSRALVGAR